MARYLYKFFEKFSQSCDSLYEGERSERYMKNACRKISKGELKCVLMGAVPYEGEFPLLIQVVPWRSLRIRFYGITVHYHTETPKNYNGRAFYVTLKR